MNEILYKDLTFKIIGCAMSVHTELGFGFLEKIYENATMISLKEQGIPAEQQISINVNYHGKTIGDFIADILVDKKVILELKSVELLHDVHRAQLLNYLKATGIRVGLLINFGKEKLEYERFIY